MALTSWLAIRDDYNFNYIIERLVSNFMGNPVAVTVPSTFYSILCLLKSGFLQYFLSLTP